MFEGNNDRKTVDESYASAVSGSSLRVGNDSNVRTPGDLIAAAGMNQYRTGMALMRLVSEWNSGAVPAQSEVPDVKELARKLAEARIEEDIRSKYIDQGLTISQKQAMRAAVKVEKADIELAHAEHRRLLARAADWSIEETKLRFQRLKALPTVRDALRQFVLEKGWVEEGSAGVDQIVADTLKHFLSPNCPKCEGRKKAVIPGTGRAIGRDCGKCRGTGEAKLEHHGRGRALLAHIRSCMARAAGDLREGAHRLRRADKSEADRFQHRHHEKVEQLQRADAEAKADAATDSSAVAAHFRASMETRRRT